MGRHKHLEMNFDIHSLIWNEIGLYGYSNSKKDRLLREMGFERIYKGRGKDYFISGMISINDTRYKCKTNLKIVDKEKYFLTKMRLGF